MPNNKKKNKGKNKRGSGGGGNKGNATTARTPTAASPSSVATSSHPTPIAMTPPPNSHHPSTKRNNNDDTSTLSDASNAAGKLPNLINRDNNDNATHNNDDDDASAGSDGSYSIPPLAKRDDSSSSGSSSGGSSGKSLTRESSPANKDADTSKEKDPTPPVPKTVEYSSSEGESEDDDELSDVEDVSPNGGRGGVEDASDDDTDEDGMPALVQRDESSQSSNDSSTSMPALVNRGSEKQQPTATATPSPKQNAAAAAAAKKKKNKKKKKGGKGEGDDSEAVKAAPSRNVDMSAVREILKKFSMEDQDEMEVYNAITTTRKVSGVGFMTGPQRMERQFLLELAHDNFQKLAKFVGVDSSSIPEPNFVVKMDEPPTVDSVLTILFHNFLKNGEEDNDNDVDDDNDKENVNNEGEKREQLWTLLDDVTTSPILKAALSSSVESLKWFEQHASDALEVFANQQNVRQQDVTVLLDAGVSVSARSVAALFSKLPEGAGHSFNNNVARILVDRSTMFITHQNDFKLVMDAISKTLGKQKRLDVNHSLKEALSEFKRSKNKNQKVVSLPSGSPKKNNKDTPPTKEMSLKAKMAQEEAEKRLAELKLKTHKITGALQWYTKLLEDLNITAASVVGGHNFDDDEEEEDEEKKDGEDTRVHEESLIKKPKNALTSDQVVEALENCDSEELLADVEGKIDLFEWDSMSEWTIDITEHAHKFFRRHIKKDRVLCERIIRRLTMLSTGRWPYVLCKPLKSTRETKLGKKISLYETKIDSASRIIWEVAIAFSPRRSSVDQNFCEQVIRVWDIVLDHDNLSRSIDQTIERIEKSHLRGEECAIYAEIDKSSSNSANPQPETLNDDTKKNLVTRIPRVFPMSQEVTCIGSARDETPKGKSRHFHPASDDPRQYTLLKFYELNAGAVKMLLDGQDESMDLPFTPGPKEHEIIHFKADPQRSILLMGRSGTGKTTCLVFRMWAQYTQYIDGQHGARPRQLFLTKNDVLCREVKRSFNNMGLAWKKRHDPTSPVVEDGSEMEEVKPKFLTSSEWLDALDASLPGQSFFTKYELKQRFDNRKNKDSVTTGIEALLSEEVEDETTAKSFRQEMTYAVFRKLWRKIRSGSGSQMDCTMVWREIKSFIKGSVAALHIDAEGQDELSQNRFLSLDEYLALPRKQSRMDENQRREIYDLYLNYEKLKKEGSYYDECDLVYNIAGRITGLNQSAIERMVAEGSNLLPIDSLFVDEVQDFTQAELYILANLCRDPNNLFLAGDTAQSIAIGVDFRFTDVRQIFYNSFGGIEPKLLQLSHNYRSHAGVLRLAACVVELLYHFFGNSLDKLPPDLGLFSGPKPIIMDVNDTQELVLMLQGAKRETSRIEFGAHQVVIVRNDEAKKTLPDEFGIDPDWVMTVQESKGLEFDDVLLYNFFSDSPAEDLWRAVSSYSEADIAAYYQDATVAASGVQKYDWESPMLNETRHLEFNSDQHKILETELKMLYTAITRARVNIFIAETNTDQSRPMFNYFQKRCVVDVLSKDANNEEEGLSGVRIFGAMNTVEDWRNRGEYYLRNAEGERQIGCLRLAAKCFDKAGDLKRRDYALAFLSFTEIEDQDPSKLKGKQGVELKEQLYSITEQLLEARDVGFLNKAALCLLRTGEQEEYTAQLFELYARLSYTQRICDEEGDAILPMAQSTHEKKYFSYAAKLFSKCSQQRGIKFDLSIDAFRNYVSAGLYEEAAELINSEVLPIHDHDSFAELYNLCTLKQATPMDPTSTFRKAFKRREGKVQCIITAVKQVASRL